MTTTINGVKAFAPGRVNFIGEHTDYNGGLVMPAALNLGVTVTASKLSEPVLKIRSIDFNKTGSFPIAELKRDDSESWANCPKGMTAVLNEIKPFSCGCEVTITGNIPLGSGLSSSAACEVAVGKALCTLFGIELTPMELALAAQQAEHRFTGTLCGIMDQAASALGKKDCLIKLDCAKLEWEYVPFKLNGVKLLITNTGVKHNLADGEYNKRRKECSEALNVIKTVLPDMRDLASCSPDWIRKNKSLFQEVVYKRALHASTEQDRVLKASAALAAGELAETGRLMTASHRSLQNDYEVSCEELDWLVDNALSISGVYGARMTGGGFGGCMIALLDESSVELYRKSMAGYKEK
ncbi:MAG: galactokinase, partial [Fibrobacteres bacterium]|nr:galactokinase [Fibrobacterota bacterium]